MRWRLLDLVPVVSTDGPDMARSAAGRLASEIALIPTAFGGATWTAGDSPDTAVATFGAGEEQERVELHLGPAGQLRDVLIQRWGNPDGSPFGRYPFGVTVDGERTDAGVTLPADRARRVVARNRPAGRRRVLPRPHHQGHLPLTARASLGRQYPSQ